ncbi:hypothetical protein Tco_0837806 [Tanacetum coccineum]
MEFYTKLQQRVLDLEKTKTTQAHEITSLKLRVKKLEKKGGSRTHKLKRLYKVGRSTRMVSSDDASLGDQEDTSKQGRKINDIDKDAKITLIDETQGRYGDDLMFDTCVLDDEEVFSGQDMDEKEINVAEKEVSTADSVTTAGEVVTTASPTKTTIADDLTLAQTLIEIRSAKSKVKGVMIGEHSESTTRTRSQQLPSKDKAQMKAELEEEDRLVRQREEEANIVSWDNVQAMIDADYQMAQQMQAEEHEKLSIEEKSKLFVQLLEARKKHFAAIRAKEKRNKPPTKAQKRNTMSTYLKNIAGYKHNQLKNKSFDDIQKLFDKAMKRVNTFVDMGTELVEGSEVRAEGSETRAEGSSKRAKEELEQESSKKQKLEEDKESEEVKQCLEIVPNDGDDVTIGAIPLSTKSSTIMLKNFDREDLEVLWSIVKERFKKTEPVNYMDNFLLLNLKTMFEHHVEDNVWKNQQGLVKVMNWKLYDSCGVHCVTMQSMLFYLLVEKMYPLTKHTLHQMFNDVKLQVDYECRMAFEILILVKKQLKEGYGRIVGIKRLHDDLEVTAAKVCVTAAKLKSIQVGSTVADSDSEEDPEKDPTEYPTNGGDDDDESSNIDDDDDDDEEEEEEKKASEDDNEEEEDHPALAASFVIHVDDLTPMLAATEALINAVAVVLPSSPPPSPLTPLSSPLPQIPSQPLPVPYPPLPLPSPLTHTSLTYDEAPLGYKATRIRLRAASPSTHHPSEIPSQPLLLPSTTHRDDIPEADMMLRKRARFSSLASRFEVGESSAAVATRQAGHALTSSVDYRFIDTMDASIRAAMSRAMTAAWAHSESRSQAIEAQIRALQRDVNVLQRQRIRDEDRLMTPIQHDHDRFRELICTAKAGPQDGTSNDAGSSC